MRWRATAILSLGVNLLLAGVCITILVSNRSSRNGRSQSDTVTVSESNAPQTKVVLRRQFFSWREVESADYPTYIANLRDIGCPEQTVRDIIIADVNNLFARRRANELVTSEQQWWRSEPDTNVLAVAAQKSRALEDERRGLLTRLLGTNWEAGDLVSLPRPSRPGIILDGPVLGQLPSETKQAIQEVNVRSQERLETYLEDMRGQGKNPDPIELAKLRQETRTDLQKILTAPQLEEFLLRYSQNANEMRTELGQLQYFTTTPDEFRNMFRGTDLIDQQLAMLGNANDPNSALQRKNLQDQRENAIKLALGPQRYEEYRLLHDPVYRDAFATAVEEGTPEAARTIYQINLETIAEKNRIQNDPLLTAQQKNVELKRTELEQAKANTVAAGQEPLPDPPSPTTQAQQPVRRTHMIRPGDTPAVVALMYGLPISALQAANPNLNFNRLKAGDSLTIPSTSLPTSVP
jgi:LysM repeat protein